MRDLRQTFYGFVIGVQVLKDIKKLVVNKTWEVLHLVNAVDKGHPSHAHVVRDLRQNILRLCYWRTSSQRPLKLAVNKTWEVLS